MLIIGIILGIIVILAILAIIYKNKFVILDNRVKNSWSQIDVQMQNRFSLVPNLVETVKGYAKHEKILLKVFQMRKLNICQRVQQKKKWKQTIN